MLVAAPAAAVASAPSGVRVRDNVPYQASDSTQLMKVYLPPVSNHHGPFPGIVYVHGGGWTTGDRQAFASMAITAAKQGYVGFSIEYNMTPPGRFPREVRDVDAAIKAVRSRAKEFDLDPNRLAGVGGSAGAHLIMQAVVTDHAPVEAVVGWSGPYDLRKGATSGNSVVKQAIGDFLGCDITAAPCLKTADAASPAQHVDASAPPAMLFNSDNELVSVDQMTEMRDALVAHQVPVQTKLFRGTRHAGAYIDDATSPSLLFLDKWLRIGANDPVQAYYQRLGGTDSYIVKARGPEYPTAHGGRAQDFSGGSIYWSSATGAHVVRGAIRAHYVALGGPAGVLGYPTTDERGTPDGVGRYNHFGGQGGGSIYWTPRTGAHAVYGAIRAHWRSLGWERGVLGYPTTDERGTPDGVGRYNHFSGGGGGSIYWTPRTGAWSVHGAIRARWASLGWERSRLGYPVSDEYGIRGGRANRFVHGTARWNPRTGVHITYW